MGASRKNDRARIAQDSRPTSPPREVIAELNRATNDFIADKQVEARMIEEGADPAGGTPEKFGAFVRSEFEKWRTVVRESEATVN